MVSPAVQHSSRASTSRHSSSSSGPQQLRSSAAVFLLSLLSAFWSPSRHSLLSFSASVSSCRPSSVPSTSALCSVSCRFARPPISLRRWCEPAAVGCCWNGAARVGSTYGEHCATSLSVVLLSIVSSISVCFCYPLSLSRVVVSGIVWCCVQLLSVSGHELWLLRRAVGSS